MIDNALAEYATWGPLTTLTFVVTVFVPLIAGVFTFTRLSNAKKMLDGRTAELQEARRAAAAKEKELSTALDEFRSQEPEALLAEHHREYNMGNYSRAWGIIDAAREDLKRYAPIIERLSTKEVGLLPSDPAGRHQAARDATALACLLSGNPQFLGQRPVNMFDLARQPENFFTVSLEDDWVSRDGHARSTAMEMVRLFELASDQNHEGIMRPLSERGFANAMSSSDITPLEKILFHNQYLDGLEIEHSAHQDTRDRRKYVISSARRIIETMDDNDNSFRASLVTDRHEAQLFNDCQEWEQAHLLLESVVGKLRIMLGPEDSSTLAAIKALAASKKHLDLDLTEIFSEICEINLKRFGPLALSTILANLDRMASTAGDIAKLDKQSLNQVTSNLETYKNSIKSSPVYKKVEGQFAAAENLLEAARVKLDQRG